MLGVIGHVAGVAGDSVETEFDAEAVFYGTIAVVECVVDGFAG